MDTSSKPTEPPIGELIRELPTGATLPGIDPTPELINDPSEHRPYRGSDLRPYGWGMFMARLCALIIGYSLLLPAIFFSVIFFFASAIDTFDKLMGSGLFSEHADKAKDLPMLLPLFAPASIVAWTGFLAVCLIWLIGRKVPGWISLATFCAGLASCASFGIGFFLPLFFSFPAFALVAAAHFFPGDEP